MGTLLSQTAPEQRTLFSFQTTDGNTIRVPSSIAVQASKELAGRVAVTELTEKKQ